MSFSRFAFATALTTATLLGSTTTFASEPVAVAKPADADSGIAPEPIEPEPKRFAVHGHLGSGVGAGTLWAQFGVGSTWWLSDRIGLGVRYNAMGDGLSDAKEVYSGLASVSVRSRPVRHHVFASVWAGPGWWTERDYSLVLAVPGRSEGVSAHLGAEAGYRWQFGPLEVGPAFRAETFRMEKQNWSLSFNGFFGLTF